MTEDTSASEDAFADLIERSREGCQEAREALLRRILPRVSAMVHARLEGDVRRGRPWLRGRFSTGDVVQEVCRQLLDDLPTFAGSTEESFIGYLAASIRHRIIDAIRFHEAARRDGRRTEPVPELVDPAARQAGPGTNAASAEEFQAFCEVLESFPERERFLLRARIEDEARFSDLAVQLGYSSTSAAKRAFYRAQAQLVVRVRQALSPEEDA